MDISSLQQQQPGMRLRDLERYNQALLAGHAWRIVKDKDSLIHKVYEAKYELSEDNVRLGKLENPTSALQGWRSLQAGLELIKQHSGVVVNVIPR